MKDVKYTIAPVVLANMFNKASGIINLTRRIKGPKCKICSGPKCVRINIYMEGSKKGDETENMREIMKKKIMQKNNFFFGLLTIQISQTTKTKENKLDP